MKNLIVILALLAGTSVLADHHEGDKKPAKKIIAKGTVNCDSLKTDEEKKMCHKKMNAKTHEHDGQIHDENHNHAE